jgi:hypothetical protein
MTEKIRIITRVRGPDDQFFNEEDLAVLLACVENLMNVFDTVPEKLTASVIASFMTSFMLTNSTDPKDTWDDLDQEIRRRLERSAP